MCFMLRVLVANCLAYVTKTDGLNWKQFSLPIPPMRNNLERRNLTSPILWVVCCYLPVVTDLRPQK